MSQGYIASGLSALANATQTGAYQISSIAYLNQFTTVTAVLNSCLLPANPQAGQICKIRNDSATSFSLNVYPQLLGQINGLGANVAFAIPCYGVVEFIANGSLNWLVSTSSIVPFSSASNVSGSTNTVAYVANAYTVPLSFAGNTFFLPAAGAATVVNVPTAVGNSGLRYKFQLSALAGNTITITPVAGAFNGCLLNNVAAGVTCIACTAAATAGSTLEIVSDGTNYIATGFGTLSGAGWA